CFGHCVCPSRRARSRGRFEANRYGNVQQIVVDRLFRFLFPKSERLKSAKTIQLEEITRPSLPFPAFHENIRRNWPVLVPPVTVVIQHNSNLAIESPAISDDVFQSQIAWAVQDLRDATLADPEPLSEGGTAHLLGVHNLSHLRDEIESDLKKEFFDAT